MDCGGVPNEVENWNLERVGKALADPRRFEILELVASNPGIPCGEIVERVPLSQPTVSHHLKELGLAGLVEARRDGPYTRFYANHAAMDGYLNELRSRLLRDAHVS